MGCYFRELPEWSKNERFIPEAANFSTLWYFFTVYCIFFTAVSDLCVECISYHLWLVGFTPFIPKSAKYQNLRKIPNFILLNIEKQMAPCKSTAKEVSFEWSHHRITSTDSKVRSTLYVFLIDSSDKVNLRVLQIIAATFLKEK